MLPQERLSSARIESPHDPDCHYRKKGVQKQKGYSINITETCNPDNPINLITNIIVAPASVADNNFLIPAIEETQNIVPQKIETLNADGGYHSVQNQDYCAENNCDFVISAIAGYTSRLEHSFDDESNLICFDTQTGTFLPTREVVPRKENVPKKWAVTLPENNRIRHITQHDVDISLLRKQIANRSKEELNLRSNVEATIFQLGYHYRANKSRYRGLIKHKIWAYARCMWINFMRIMKYIASRDPNSENMCLDGSKNVNMCVFFVKKIILYVIFSFEKTFRKITPFLSSKLEIIESL